MHAHAPRAHLGGNGGHSRSCGIGQQRAGFHATVLPDGGKEALARGSHQHREFSVEELRQGLEQRPVILRSFGKAQARIEHDIIAAHAGRQRIIRQSLEGLMHIAHHIATVVGATGRGAKGAFLQRAPVHQAHGHAGLGHRAIHLRISQATGDVINHVHAGRCGRTGHRGAHRIHGGADAQLTQRLNDGNHAALFDVRLHPHRTRPGGLTADVNHVRALRHEFAGVVDGGIDVQPLTAIGEGILRDVDNAHHQRAVGNGQIRYRGCLLHGVLLFAFSGEPGFSCESG